MLSIRDDSNSLDPGLVQLLVNQGRILLSWQIALCLLLVYDTLITLDKEVEFFWGVSFRKPVTIVYFINRYIGIFGQVARLFSFMHNQSLVLCSFAQWASGAANWVTIVTIDYILLVRVLALCSKEKKISIFLSTLFGLAASSLFAFTFYICWVQGVFVLPIARDTTVCIGERLPPLSFVIISWSIPMSYELLLMLFALYKAAEYWKMSAGFKGFTLVSVLIQDQAVYFILVIAVCILNIVTTKVQVDNQILASILQQAGSPTFLCILGNRMLFNLKEAAKRGMNEGTTYHRKSVSQMEFAPPVEIEIEGGHDMA